MITKELKGTKAITLIAMVISILVLLILAGVSLALVVGETGITQRAVTAKKTYDIAGAKEKLELQIAGYAGDFYQAKYINGNIGDSQNVGDYVLGKFTNGSDFEGDYTLTKDSNKITITNKKDTGQKATATIDENGKVSWSGAVTEPEEETIALLKDQTRGVILSTTENTKLKDNKNNIIIIPADFKISTENADNGDAGNNVEEGIIIEDASGNQFVWVPVGTITRSDGNTTTIALSRYEFASDGTATAKGPGDVIDSYFTETIDNTVARKDESGNIEFIEKSKVGAAGGYYIGRFEAGEGNVCKYNVAPYTNVYRGGVENYSGALELAQGMYISNPTLYKSDLMNSYAWDTAIYFIQQCGTASNHSTFSITRAESTTSSKANTGKNLLNATSAVDVQCNIYDMAGNVAEWTTEYSSESAGPFTLPCVCQGGFYNGGYPYTSYRKPEKLDDSYNYVGFRTLLYVI